MNSGKTEADFGSTTIKFYGGFPATPNGTALPGVLNYASFADMSNGMIQLRFAGSIAINTPGTYWGKLADITSGKSIWLRYGDPRIEAFAFNPWIPNPPWRCVSDVCSSTSAMTYFMSVNITQTV